MKAIFLLFVFTCGLIFCKSQHNNVIVKNGTTEHLKIGDLKKGNYKNERGDIVQQFKTNNTGKDYLQNISSNTSPVEVLKQFHQNTILRNQLSYFIDSQLE